MNRSRRDFTLLTATAALLLVACEGPIGPDSNRTPPGVSARSNAAPQPFRFRGDGAIVSQQFATGFPNATSDFGGRCVTPAHFLIRFAVTGVATHMGRTGGTLEHCTRIDFQTGRPAFLDGVISLRAANGDELSGTYVGGPHPAGGFRDDVTFIGGTGRFADASGVAIQHGACDQSSGTCVLQIDGSITYNGSH